MKGTVVILAAIALCGSAALFLIPEHASKSAPLSADSREPGEAEGPKHTPSEAARVEAPPPAIPMVEVSKLEGQASKDFVKVNRVLKRGGLFKIPEDSLIAKDEIPVLEEISARVGKRINDAAEAVGDWGSAIVNKKVKKIMHAVDNGLPMPEGVEEMPNGNVPRGLYPYDYRATSAYLGRFFLIRPKVTPELMNLVDECARAKADGLAEYNTRVRTLFVRK